MSQTEQSWFEDAKKAALDEITERKALVEEIVTGLADAIRVLRHRDGVWISDDMCKERGRNIAFWLVNEYEVKRRTP